MDAITLLKNDHKTVEALFKRFEKAGDNALAEKRAVVDQIIEELAIHAAIEEQLFYPVTRATVPETEAIVLESLEEHHIVKWVLSELDSMDPQDERFDAKVTVLIENVRHHVKEEEQEYFPKVRDELGRNALDDLGDAMVRAKAVAPTHPHPRSPDSPPGNLLVGTAAGVVDRVTDTANGLAQGGVTALGDLIATVLRRKKPRVAPTGSKSTRATATKVREAAADATEAVIEAAQGPSPPPRVRPVPPAGAPAERREQPSPAPRPPPLQPASRPSGPRLRPSGARPRPAALLARPPSAPRQPPSARGQPPSARGQPPSARGQPPSAGADRGFQNYSEKARTPARRVSGVTHSAVVPNVEARLLAPSTRPRRSRMAEVAV